MTEEKKKTIIDVKKEVEEYFTKEKMSAREILMVLREIENDAMIVLIMGQLIAQKEKDGTDKKVS